MTTKRGKAPKRTDGAAVAPLEELSAPEPLFPPAIHAGDVATPQELAHAVLHAVIPIVSESLGRETSECIDLVARVAGNLKADGDELRASLLRDAERLEHQGWFTPPAHIVCCIACAYAGQALRTTDETRGWAFAINAQTHLGFAFGLLNRELRSDGQAAWARHDAAVWKAAAEAALPHVGKVRENSRRAALARRQRERNDPTSSQYAKQIAYEAFLRWNQEPGLYSTKRAFVDALRSEYPSLAAADSTIETRWVPKWRKNPLKGP